jgi:hypothetical protein
VSKHNVAGFVMEASAMVTVQGIEQAVSQLSLEELARFREWFDAFDAKIWDEQFEADAKSGKLDRLTNQAIADFNAGKYREL